jgi:hypothetical protein
MKTYLRPGIKAIREHWRPFILIQLMAVALVVTYYRWPTFQHFCEHLIVWKTRVGILFPMLTSAFAGSVLPEIAKVVTTGNTHFPRERWRTMGFHFLFFALNGLIVDYFYRFQAYLFGSGIDWLTLAKKTAFDMWVFTTLLTAPLGITAFLWRHNRYDTGKTLRAWSWRLYEEKVVPILLPNWCYWIPMVLCVYALPSPLQFWLFLLAFAAWSLVFVSLATQADPLDPI